MRYVIIPILLFLSNFVSAQEFYKGSKLGLGTAVFETVNFSDRTITPQVSGHSNPGLYVQGGGVSVYEVNDWFGLRADFQVSYTSASGKGSRYVTHLLSQTKADYTEEYINLAMSIPLAFRLRYEGKSMGFYGEAGYMFQCNFLNTYSKTYDNAAINDNHGIERQNLDVSNVLTHYLNFGIGVDVYQNQTDRRYFLELRSFPELSPLGSVEGNKVRMQGFTLGFGFVI